MKKGRILLKSLIGFPIGTLLLMLAYIEVFLIENETVFIKEMLQLLDVKILILQILMIGIIYSLLIFLAIIYKEEFDEKEKIRKMTSRKMIMIFLFLISIAVSDFILARTKIFSINIGIITGVNLLIVITIYILVQLIRITKEMKIIKEINNKLKD